MKEPAATPERERKEQLREQAARWFARMRRDDAERFRQEFEHWLAIPEHLAAYNRIAGRFAEAKILRGSHRAPTRPARRRTAFAALLSIATLAAFGTVALVAARIVSWPIGRDAHATSQIMTAHGEIRRIRLGDGSVVTLDTDSLVSVALGSRRRALRLERGRARFEVAHEARPFVVTAGGGSITARGTIFDVALDGSKVEVTLIEGRVDVVPQVSADTRTRRLPHRLEPGEAVAFQQGQSRSLPSFSSATPPGWPEAMIDVRNRPLSDVLVLANRHGSVRLVAGDMRLGQITVSGRFRIDDAGRLAENLARLLDLEVDRSTPGSIVLKRRHEKISPAP